MNLLDQAKIRVDNSVEQLRETILYFQERAFVIIFSSFSTYFIYNLIFVDEDERMSNESIFWGVFISTLFAFIAHLTLQQQKAAASNNKEVKYKDKRRKESENELLNYELKESLRRAMVNEQQKRVLVQGNR